MLGYAIVGVEALLGASAAERVVAVGGVGERGVQCLMNPSAAIGMVF
ncbi:hypothetical protein AB0J84_08065 [Micromonospora arborensis]